MCVQARKLLPLLVWRHRGQLLRRHRPAQRRRIPVHAATAGKLRRVVWRDSDTLQRQGQIRCTGGATLGAKLELQICTPYSMACIVAGSMVPVQAAVIRVLSGVVQHVYYVDEMAAVLADLGPSALHVLSGTNTDSGRKTPVTGFRTRDCG
jgi:hypothetical protein